MTGDVKISSYVCVPDGCSMRFRVNGADGVEFSFGGRRDPFEFLFDAEALRAFLRLGADAMRELDGHIIVAQEKAALG
jgi:hypothetical protein